MGRFAVRFAGAFAFAVFVVVVKQCVGLLFRRCQQAPCDKQFAGCCQGFLREGREGISPLSFEPAAVSADSQGRDVDHELSL